MYVFCNLIHVENKQTNKHFNVSFQCVLSALINNAVLSCAGLCTVAGLRLRGDVTLPHVVRHFVVILQALLLPSVVQHQ